MTPLRNDARDPFGDRSLWPRAPLAAPDGGRTAIRFETQADEDGQGLLWFDSHRTHVCGPPVWAAEDEDEGVGGAIRPLAAEVIPLRPYLQPARRRELRLTPLIAAASVGAGGLLALFLLIGLAPDRRTEAALTPAPASRLAVGALVATSDPAGGPTPGGAPGGR